MYQTQEYRIPLTRDVCEEIGIEWTPKATPAMAAKFKEIFNNLDVKERLRISRQYRR